LGCGARGYVRHVRKGAQMVDRIIEKLGAEVGLDLPPVQVTGDDPVLPSIFKVGTAAAACVGAVTAAAAILERTRSAEAPSTEPDARGPSTVAVDVRESAVAFRDERYFRIDGEAPIMWASLSGDYQAADGWVRLHCNFDHHRDAVLRALHLHASAERAEVAKACAGRTARDIEQAVIDMGGCAAAMRSRAEWQEHPQGRAVAELPLIGLHRLGPATTDTGSGGGGPGGEVLGPAWTPGPASMDCTSTPPGSPAVVHGGAGGGPAVVHGGTGGVQGGAGSGAGGVEGGLGDALVGGGGGRPLAGVRVLDLTRVIAGPVATRTLAAYGAQVLRVGAAHLSEVPGLAISTAFGKRSCELDLRTEEGADAFEGLVAGADVVVQSYRPGALAALGFGPRELAAIRPGIVCVDISAYGSRGPWAERRGFDSLVQMVCGIAHEGGRGERPVPLPAQVLDHATGWFAALGVIAGLLRRKAEGGSWHVQVALARTALWLDGLGRMEAMGQGEPEVDDLLQQMGSSLGNLTYVRAPGRIGDARPYWPSPPPNRGEHPPEWV
jgi:CoA-transferase family III